MVQGIFGNTNQNSYGDIRRSGYITGGRTVYTVIDSNGHEAGKLSVPHKQTDSFEKAYKDIIRTAPKIQQYAREHSTEQDRQKRLKSLRFILATGGFIGAAIPLAILRNSTSVIKQVLGSVAGIVVGISSAFGVSMFANSPPGTVKFARATHELSKIDIQPYYENEK